MRESIVLSDVRLHRSRRKCTIRDRVRRRERNMGIELGLGSNSYYHYTLNANTVHKHYTNIKRYIQILLSHTYAVVGGQLQRAPTSSSKGKQFQEEDNAALNR
ncbi:hypothetical protein G7K_4383-t1 [Saitoella complicata NRRL Y-17804]|uniref:Uncharacterized protein n=1 Tax=Saitoella complicata (strain BCRC 22490 / CBS 7301 / JCM 7358 / NBRC 10748 / NRRL Y-17804) TaxID=698492 RepID=A0A0E9NKL8_SAICN|nr:hypothetical protein G7K_4383-t1 [Saitoella complicata NRRL Y-17804]